MTCIRMGTLPPGMWLKLLLAREAPRPQLR
jgi:hypothetical protein